MPELIIPDPGLREYAGHHPAMVEAILNTDIFQSSDWRLSVHGHKNCDSGLLSLFNQSNVFISKYFTTDFYSIFNKELDLFGSQKYIKKLTIEYVGVFESSIGSTDKVFLFHTLSWQHAVALSIAISIYKRNSIFDSKILVFLMFNPALSDKSNNSFLYSYGFRSLAKHAFVTFFAADYELKLEYERILEREIDIHPCVLSGGDVANVEDNDVVKIILYVGDAKPEKGFMDIPYLIKSYCRNLKDPNYEFVVQYTIASQSCDLEIVSRKIKELAKIDTRVSVIDSFLTQNKLEELFASSEMIIFNYDEKEYQNKSSGVLWLAAKYNLTMKFLTDTWLNREAKRLGGRIAHLPVVEISKKTEEIDCETSNNNYYRSMLFKEFGCWLKEACI